MFRGNFQVIGRQHIEILGLRQFAEQRVQGQFQQAQATRALRHVEAQLAAIEPLALADIQAFHQVFIIADENERRAARMHGVLEFQLHAEKRIAAQGRHQRPAEGQPLAPSQPALLLFAVAHDIGIQAQAGIVQENAAIHFAHVDLVQHALRHIGDRRIERQRNIQILGEMVQGTQRQDAKRRAAADNDGGDGIDGAVASAGHDDGRAITQG